MTDEKLSNLFCNRNSIFKNSHRTKCSTRHISVITRRILFEFLLDKFLINCQNAKRSLEKGSTLMYSSVMIKLILLKFLLDKFSSIVIRHKFASKIRLLPYPIPFFRLLRRVTDDGQVVKGQKNTLYVINIQCFNIDKAGSLKPFPLNFGPFLREFFFIEIGNTANFYFCYPQVGGNRTVVKAVISNLLYLTGDNHGNQKSPISTVILIRDTRFRVKQGRERPVSGTWDQGPSRLFTWKFSNWSVFNNPFCTHFKPCCRMVSTDSEFYSEFPGGRCCSVPPNMTIMFWI